MSKLSDSIKVFGGLARLNSITKYPSIPTYHGIGERGRLTEEVLEMGKPPYLVTEKIDGTSARIILSRNGWVIGSREELLAAQGDLIGNPALGIVETLKGWAEEMWQAAKEDLIGWRVIYPEVYGGKTTAAARNYTESRDKYSARVFDIASLTPDLLKGIVDLKREQISGWREHTKNRDRFLGQDLEQFCHRDIKLPDGLKMVPRPCMLQELPDSIEATLSWMEAQAKVTVDGFYAAMDASRVEGFVVRSFNGPQIMKVRFQDYRRTLKGKTLKGAVSGR